MDRTKPAAAKRVKEIRIGQPVLKYYGICTTCNFAGECENSTRGEAPVWYCDQFDDHTVVSKQKTVEFDSDSAGKYGAYKGLCMNCEKRESCDHSRTEGGIWHCEEYL